MNMTVTQHARVRCQQRGIRPADLDLALRLGAETTTGAFFGRREADDLIRQLKGVISRLERLKNTCVVTEDEFVITAYKSCNRRGRGKRLGEH